MTKAAPRCRHFGECGGCRMQDLSYEAQLERKGAALKELFGRPVEVRPSPDIWYYRNKVELSFHLNYDRNPETKKLEPAEAVLGFKRRGRWYETIDLEECLLLSPELPALLKAVRGWAVENDLPVWDPKRRGGVLRQLVLREGKNTGERLAMLLSAKPEWPRDSFVKAVRSAYPATTVAAGLNDKPADAAQADAVETLAGPGFITEALTVGGRRRTFRISPFSFFQTNTRGAEVLYGLIRGWAEASPAEVLFDLYGGSATIGISLSDLVGKVVSVESAASAVADARVNAEANGAANIEFVEASVEKWLRTAGLPEGAQAVLDPPRSGLHPKAVTALAERPLCRLLYVSCNPKLLARDLPALAGAYELESLRAVDLFPHTDHVEVVAALRAR